MKQYAPLIIAALLVAASAGYFFWPSEKTGGGDASVVASGDAPVPPPLAPVPKGRLGLPKITRLTKSVSCLSVEGDRYGGTEAARFRSSPREGVSVYNGCAEPVVVIDVKASDTSDAFVYSILPSRAVLIQPRSSKESRKDRLIALSRDGARCDETEEVGDICRFLPIPPKHAVFFSTPYAQWFSLRLKTGGALTGFLEEPVDPTAPPKPKTVPKMPEKGFKFRRVVIPPTPR